MKKNSLLLVVLAIAVMSLISCSKKDDVLNVPIKQEQVRIFVSSLSSQNGLKSASTVSDTIGVANGDTIKEVRDVPVLMRAIDADGKPVNGRWEIYLVENDYLNSALMSLNNYFGQFGDQIGPSLSENGVYKVVFKNFTSNDEIRHFFVFIGGIPGKVGDDYANDFIFRMEIKSVVERSSNKTKELVFVYFKYAEKPQAEEAYCFIKSFNINKVFLGYKNIELNLWSFNKDYYYFIIDPAQDSPGDYRIASFVTSKDGISGWLDNNNYFSSWASGWDGIKFAVR